MIHALALKGEAANGAASIEITLKLFAMLERWLPPGAQRNEIRLSVPEGATPGAIIAALDMPEALCHLVLVNGAFVKPEVRLTKALKPGDALSIWPPIAGG